MSHSRSHSRTRHTSRHHRSRSRSGSLRSRSRSRSSRYSRRASWDKKSHYEEIRKPSRHRSHSRSPMSGRQRHLGDRENPPASRCLGIFGLSAFTQETDLREVFSKYGPLEDVQIVYDAQFRRSRGFGFIYYEKTEDAAMAKEKLNGIEIDGRRIRVDFSITQRAHTPTPGIYMGRPSHNPRHRRGGRTGFRRDYFEHRTIQERPSSPYFKERRHSRSRSRSLTHSYSPRKYNY